MELKNNTPLVLIISNRSLELKQKLEAHANQAMIITANDGEQGLAILASHPVEVAIIHLRSEWQSDVELLRHIRMFFNQLPIVILAECSTLAGAEACAGLSTQGYLREPVSAGEVWRTIDNALFAMPQVRLLGNQSVSRRNEVAQAMLLIQAKHQEGVSPTQVAQQVHMSRNHLGALFKSETGHTLSEYINICRVASAMRIISRQTDLGFSRVAEMAGFSSESYFSKVFKKLSKMTPKSYRQKIMNKGPAAVGWCESLIQGMFHHPKLHEVHAKIHDKPL